MDQTTLSYFLLASGISLFTSVVIVILVYLKYKHSVIWRLTLYGNIIIFLSFTGYRISRRFNDNIMGTILLVTYLLIALIVIYFSKQYIAKPIIKLKEAADKVTSGEFDIDLPKVKTKDEIKELTASLEMLIIAFKSKLKKKK